MEVTYIPGSEVNTELGIVNAARVSLNAASKEYTDRDKKLIKYLFTHNHWTPFAHARLYFCIHWNKDEALTFYKNAHLGGFSWVELNEHVISARDIIKGSLYSWINNLQYFPKRVEETVGDIIHEAYPTVSNLMKIEAPSFCYQTPIHEWLEDYVKLKAKENKELYKVLTATLRIKVPIFIARQIRTSQVGFSYSDLYVEPESFVFNEVSRRYVDSTPEFYTIQEWRVREGTSVKQGSTGVAKDQEGFKDAYREAIRDDKMMYRNWVENFRVAPEQARALLPQCMYTEMYWTGTLHRFSQFLQLRLQKDVQQETRDFAKLVLHTLSENFSDWKEVYKLT